MAANTSSIASRMPAYQKPDPVLHAMPNEILAQILSNMPDVQTLSASTLVCRLFHEIYEDDTLGYITKATLSSLASRTIHLTTFCQFAHVAMKGGRQPSLYLVPAILAIDNHQSPCSLPIHCCRALLDLVHFKGYDEWENAPEEFDVWKWEVVVDQGRVGAMDATEPFPCGKENYHLIYFENMDHSERKAIREHLTPEEDLSLRVYSHGSL